MSLYVVSPSLSNDKNEERDVEMESDEDDCQSHSPGSGLYSQQIDKRAHQNSCSDAEFALSTLNYPGCTDKKDTEEKEVPLLSPLRKKTLPPVLEPQGFITHLMAEFAVSALVSNCHERTDKKLTDEKKKSTEVHHQSMSKMRKFLQDEQFRSEELPMLLQEEDFRTLDDAVDLNIRTEKQSSVQLVAWNRFRSAYHSGMMSIRVRNRRNRPVILVMKPTDIVGSAAHDTRDLQAMKDEPRIPDAVKELLKLLPNDGHTSLVGSSLYAFLLHDGVNWKLIGCFDPKSLTTIPTLPSSPIDDSSASDKGPDPEENRKMNLLAHLIITENATGEESRENRVSELSHEIGICKFRLNVLEMDSISLRLGDPVTYVVDQKKLDLTEEKVISMKKQLHQLEEQLSSFR